MGRQMLTRFYGLCADKRNLHRQKRSYDVKTDVSHEGPCGHAIRKAQVNVVNRDHIYDKSIAAPTCHHVEKTHSTENSEFNAALINSFRILLYIILLVIIHN